MGIKKLLVLFVLGSVLVSPVLLGDDIAEIKKRIDVSYSNGAHNKLDTKALESGFYPEFSYLTLHQDKIYRTPIKKWVEWIEKEKKKKDFDPKKHVSKCVIKKIDVANECAVARVDVYKKGKLAYTDFFQLLKFKSGWKIVNKIYTKHK